jgi:Ca-activated chloride channel family protein
MSSTLKYIGALLLALAATPLLAADATVSLPSSSGMEGGTIVIEWNGPRGAGDILAIARPDAGPTTNLFSIPVSAAGNPARLELPSRNGTYEIRYVTALPARILARATVTVTPATATLALPATGFGGSRIPVEWSGPAGPRDFIAIARPSGGADASLQLAFPRDGNPLRLRLPTAAGTYEVRYVLGASDRILARRPITVQEARATMRGPSEIGSSIRFEVVWDGPDGNDDRIMIVPAGERRPPPKPAFEVKTAAGKPAALIAPGEPGRYEVFYVTGDDNRILSRIPLRVTETPTQVSGPARVRPGTLIGVEWTGPALPADQIAIAEPGAPADKHFEAVLTGRGNPAALMVPDKPGTYELRYISGLNQKVLARSRIVVAQ